jgi:prefoldin subunit 5
VIAALVGALLSAGSVWVAWGRDVVPRHELELRLQPYERSLDELKAQIQALTQELQRQRDVLTRIEALMDRVGRRLDGTTSSPR